MRQSGEGKALTCVPSAGVGLHSGRAGPYFRFRPKVCKVRSRGIFNSRREGLQKIPLESPGTPHAAVRHSTRSRFSWTARYEQALPVYKLSRLRKPEILTAPRGGAKRALPAALDFPEKRGIILLVGHNKKEVQCRDRCNEHLPPAYGAKSPYATEISAHCGNYYTSFFSFCTGGVIGFTVCSYGVVYG